MKKNDFRIGRVAQVVESLPSKHEALSSNPNIMKRKKGKKRARHWWLTPAIPAT
jgi:hypothetical protein